MFYEMQQTKKILVIILFLIFGVVMTTVSIAEESPDTINTIYLKDGPVIDCDIGWIEGDMFYYRKHGGTIGIPFKTVDIDRTYKEAKEKEEGAEGQAIVRQAEEETERETIIRRVEEEAERSIFVSKSNENLRKEQQVQRKDRNESRYSEICKSWIGHNINDLVDKWGYPTENFKAPNGNKVYVYYKSKTIRIPERPEQRAPGFISENMRWMFESPARPAREYHLYCKTFFETDRSGKIIKVRLEGNNCQ